MAVCNGLSHWPLASARNISSLRLVKSALISVLIFCVWALFAFVARCYNIQSVLVDARIYYADGDCYSRMTRARMVDENFGTIIRHQDFENYPKGTDTHATAPMDYLIVATKWLVTGGLRIVDPDKTSVLESQVLDVAGALVSPLLGALACGFLAIYARRLPIGFGVRWTIPFFWAVSPMLVWGTVLGRPDHQSLQMVLLAVALAAECRLAYRLSRGWALASGISWAVALWVSLYEPAVLFGVVMILWACFKPRALVARERWLGWVAFVVILGVALLIEGWPVELPDPKMSTYLANWGGTIGELYHLDLRGPTLYAWLGAASVVSPILLLLACRRDRRALAGLILFLVTLTLTCWQARWGYFMALVFVLTLPWQFAALRRWWIISVVAVIALWPTFWMEGLEIRVLYLLAAIFLITLPGRPSGPWRVRLAMLRWWVFAALATFSMWFAIRPSTVVMWSFFAGFALIALIFPLVRKRRWLLMERAAIIGSVICFSIVPTLREWHSDLSPDPDKLASANLEKRLLRETAGVLRGPGRSAFLAPWWTSPPLAYWSEQPGVAGSSHEAISGTVDSARFYLAKTPQEAAAVLKDRDVSRVVADDPGRLIHTSAAILGVEEPTDCMAKSLMDPAFRPPPYLIQIFANDYFKVFAVDQAKLNP